ncbi:polyketide cyclase/dehydrase/lipid transport protein [Neolewinella xylanilytica]|uniref:Polyketide cyclase/dehydrase/lipid transport protein n=1 Tax=Neolewinella xylanilytica TaxID=1514080 RepID=A0A2S6I6T1_9BACT|nr:SRPBCC domain-containing protein [Neolewinella xylanilytica]PPK87213.1 polyketide cyclase/dehydrase/lipid transport protein [Neolewinella xylanilytica]
MAYHLTTSVRIATSPDRVWEALTDFPPYAEWNPFIQPAAGSAVVGNQLDLTIAGTRFRPRVLVAVPGRELRWLGRLGIRGLFDGEHYFLLTANGDGSTTLGAGRALFGAAGTLIPQ